MFQGKRQLQESCKILQDKSRSSTREALIRLQLKIPAFFFVVGPKPVPCHSCLMQLLQFTVFMVQKTFREISRGSAFFSLKI